MGLGDQRARGLPVTGRREGADEEQRPPGVARRALVSGPGVGDGERRESGGEQARGDDRGALPMGALVTKRAEDGLGGLALPGTQQRGRVANPVGLGARLLGARPVEREGLGELALLIELAGDVESDRARGAGAGGHRPERGREEDGQELDGYPHREIAPSRGTAPRDGASTLDRLRSSSGSRGSPAAGRRSGPGTGPRPPRPGRRAG